MIPNPSHTPRWQRHPVRVRRLQTLRDALLEEQAAYPPSSGEHRALARASRAVMTALRLAREAA